MPCELLLDIAARLCPFSGDRASTNGERSGTGSEREKKPNIVLILTDNLGYGELGVYGGGMLRGAPTSRIDKLASEGTRLLNFNVEAQCTPTRSALMTGRFSIRSGTHTVPRGGVPEGLTLWEVTLAELLSGQGYSTGIWGKWHLGSAEARLPTNRGFDEWYGIPRTYSEVLWPALNDTHSIWPSVGLKQGWDPNIVPAQPIYEARKGEKPRQVAELDLNQRRKDGKGNHHAGGSIHQDSMPTTANRFSRTSRSPWFTCRHFPISKFAGEDWKWRLG